jgi:hypothetical protein
MLHRRVEWTRNKIETEKAKVRSELDPFVEKGDLTGRLAFIQEEMDKLADDDSSRSQLRRYVLAVSSLVHHERYGGLTDSQIKGAAKIAFTILKVQGIKTKLSKIAYVYGELHLILSLVYRKAGLPFESAWEQLMAHHYSSRAPTGGPGFQSFSRAIRAMRMGHSEIALKNFVAANEHLSGKAMEQARLGQAKALRFLGNLNECELVVQSLMAGDLTAGAKLECIWELACCKIHRDHDLTAMMKLIGKDASHFQATYLIESYLWACALSLRSWREGFYKWSTLARYKDLGVRDHGVSFQAVRILEACYDDSVSLGLRLQALGEHLAIRREILLVDVELLFLLASVRWLARVGAEDMAGLILAEYKGLCMKLSSGKSQDVLGLAEDLLNRSWAAA